MKNVIWGITCLFVLTSCGAQSTLPSVATNTDGSVTLFNNGSSKNTIVITKDGNMGIGKSNPQDKLEVNGQIHARSVKVDLKEWADFVFEDGYDLPRLREIEKYIQEHGHLPNIPNTTTVLAEGIDLGEVNKLLLQKIEELTLHLIEKEKDIQSLEAKYRTLEARLLALEKNQKS